MQLVHGLLISWLLASSSSAAHPPSPCPGIFAYEGAEPEKNRWYGTISLRSRENLVGLRLDVDLDRHSDLMASWTGTITTKDNVKYTILNLNQKLIPGIPVSSRIMVKFHRSTGVPRIQFIRLNGLQICPDVNAYSSEKPPGRPNPVYELTFGESENEFSASENRPSTATTEEPFTTRKIAKQTTPVPNESGGVDKNNHPNWVSLQASIPDNDINSLINGYLQNEKKNNTPAIGNQPNPQTQGNRPNPPGSGTTTRPSGAGNVNNFGESWQPAVNNRPSPVQQSKPPNQIPNNNDQGFGNSFTGTVGSRPTTSLSEICGSVKLNVPLVTHGEATYRGQWPWHVALYRIGDVINLNYKCGGTLVSATKVITAAHCVINRGTGAADKPDKYIVHLGQYHQLQLDEASGVLSKKIKSIVLFPSYDSSSHKGDIAVLTLASEAAFSEYVVPVCLWNENSVDLAEIVGEDGTVVGWGTTEKMELSAELRMAKMPVVSQQTCLESFKEFYEKHISDKTFCAGYRNGTSVCNGDSGGGLLFYRNRKWYLRGIVSITVSKTKSVTKVCDPSYYVVFTDAAKYLDFIKSNM